MTPMTWPSDGGLSSASKGYTPGARATSGSLSAGPPRSPLLCAAVGCSRTGLPDQDPNPIGFSDVPKDGGTFFIAWDKTMGAVDFTVR